MHPGAMSRVRRLDNYSGWLEVPQNVKASEGTLWEDFETLGDWTLTGGTGGPPSLTADAVNYVTGSQSLFFDANGATGNIDYYKTVSTTFADMGTYFQLWVRNNTGANFTLQLFLANTWATKYLKYNIVIGDISNRWVLYRWNKFAHDAPAGGMTYADTVNMIRIRTSGGTIEYNIDGFKHSVETQPIVLLSFDDMSDKNTQNGPRALRLHNMVASFFVTGDYIGTSAWITGPHMNDLIAENWLLGNHGETHDNFTTLTQAQIETELTDCIADYATAGVSGHMADVYAAYPSGGYDADVDAAMAAQSFRYGRSIRNPAQPIYESVEEIELKKFDIHSDQNLTLANWLVDINAIVSKGMVYAAYNHGIDYDVLTGSDITVSMLGLLASWCARYKILPLTYDELWQLRSGPIRVRRPKRANTAW